MHPACLVEKMIVPTLDKPCPWCGQLYRCQLIIARSVLCNNDVEMIDGRRTGGVDTVAKNESVFRMLLTSITVAHLILTINFNHTSSSSSSIYNSNSEEQWLGNLLTTPFMIVSLTILVYGLFQYYLNRPGLSVLYFTDRSKVVVLCDPKSGQLLHLYIRGLYGLLVEPTSGDYRWINRHIGDTSPPWIPHRLMVP